MLQKRKKWMTTAGTAVVLLAVSLTFAFKPAKVASPPPATEYYWSYIGTGSIKDPANYRYFANTSIPGYVLDSFCPTGTDQVCTVIAPQNPSNTDRPVFDVDLTYRLHVIETGQTTYGFGIRMKSN